MSTSNHSLMTQNNSQVNMISDMLSTTKRSITSHSKNFSIPSNLEDFENIVEDITTGSNSRELIKFSQLQEIKKLLSSINELSYAVDQSRRELEQVQSNIINYQNQKAQLDMELDRVKREAFHRNIETVFIKKKLQEKKDEINEIQKSTRELSYNKYKILNGLGVTPVTSADIENVISEKKCLMTAIVIMNKKVNDLKKEIAMKAYKGVVCMKDFEKLVQEEKKENSTIVSSSKSNIFTA